MVSGVFLEFMGLVRVVDRVAYSFILTKLTPSLVDKFSILEKLDERDTAFSFIVIWWNSEPGSMVDCLASTLAVDELVKFSCLVVEAAIVFESEKSS